MNRKKTPLALSRIALGLSALLLLSAAPTRAATVTIATVNNDDMIVMKKLSTQWEHATGNKLNWVVLEENTLRQRVTTDIATKGGQFDIITIGAFETPIWAKLGWLTPLNDLGADYDYPDIFQAVRNGLSVDGKLYAVPFYAESSFTLYRSDLFKAAGLTMPAQPTWDQIATMADKLTDREHGINGICLRGKPGWGESMGIITTVANTFGGQWFNMQWHPQLTSAPWKKAVSFYVDLLRRDGPAGATSNGFNENQALFARGKCAIWVDATSAAGRLYNKQTSQVGDVLAFAPAPIDVTPKGAAWFWVWSLAIPTTSQQIPAAKAFVKWATSKAYIDLVGTTNGWVTAPPGTRISTYENPNYKAAAPFAEMVEKALLSVDPNKPTMKPSPYTGIQFVSIPQFQAIGTLVSQDISAAMTGEQTVPQVLQKAQNQTTAIVRQAGYLK